MNNFEQQWQDRLTDSARKSREWLFKHAREVYDFREECHAKPEYGPKYFALKMHEWLGYSDESAREWANVGKFLYTINYDYLKNLPVSMRSLLECSRMSKGQLMYAIDNKIITVNSTSLDIRDYRKTLTVIAGKNLPNKNSKDGGTIYLQQWKEMSGVYRIGVTTRSPENREYEMSANGNTWETVCSYDITVSIFTLESMVRQDMSKYSPFPNKEMFGAKFGIRQFINAFICAVRANEALLLNQKIS